MRRAGIAAIALLAGSFGFHHAKADGDSRTISLHHVHTGEDLTITYKQNGRYDEDALKKINWLLRDWRKSEATKMDPEEIDLLWEVYREVGATEPIQIICGYRSPETNAMLRRRSKGVARFSQHTLGKAIDFYIPGIPLDKLRATAMKMQGGGVGYYPTSGSPFVHLDVGNVRAWPRMTREQLVKLFPDGRTVHLPADGNPLPGYQLALADLERGALRRTAEPPKKRSLLARLFGAPQDAEESDDNAAASQSAEPTRRDAAAPKPAAPARMMAVAASLIENVPLPRTRPIYQVASAENRPVPAPFQPRIAEPAPAALSANPAPAALSANPAPAVSSANDVIVARGFWDSNEPVPRPPADVPATDLDSARRQLADGLLAAAGRDATASTGPFARPDRVPADVALAYAAQANANPAKSRPPVARTMPPSPTPAPALVVRKANGSVAAMPQVVMRNQAARVSDSLNDPWLRGLTLAASVQDSMIVTPFGDPDYARLVEFMQKPRTAVMMTFSHDPHLGMTDKAFSGSAVVFQATVTFEAQRTAAIQ